MTARPPLWFLDVDGVLCPLNGIHGPQVHGDTPHRHGHEHAGHGTAAELWVCWTPSVVERVAGLHDEGRVEIVWLTTWGADAAHLSPVLGLPTLDVVALRGRSKLDAGLHRLAEEPVRPAVWTDDAITARWRIAATQQHDGPVLLLAPSPRTGLTHGHLGRIEAFLRAVAA